MNSERVVYSVDPARWPARYRLLIHGVASHAIALKNNADIRRSYAASEGRGSVWLAHDVRALGVVASGGVRKRTDHRLLLFAVPTEATRQMLSASFRSVVPVHPDVHLLPFRELAAVLVSPRRDDLFIGGIVDRIAKTVVLYRGTVAPLVVPWNWFTARAHGATPDFSAFAVIDHGQTIRFGAYEVAADAILYECDSAARARQRHNVIEHDHSLGGSIRRLRLQRGLRQTDFPGITEKTIARIERNEIAHPRRGTLACIAARLGTKVEDLNTY
jgi:hypothetical protein